MTGISLDTRADNYTLFGLQPSLYDIPQVAKRGRVGVVLCKEGLRVAPTHSTKDRVFTYL